MAHSHREYKEATGVRARSDLSANMRPDEPAPMTLDDVVKAANWLGGKCRAGRDRRASQVCMPISTGERLVDAMLTTVNRTQSAEAAGGSGSDTTHSVSSGLTTVKSLHDAAMSACDRKELALAALNEAAALELAVRSRVSTRTIYVLADSLSEIAKNVRDRVPKEGGEGGR